jgi:hypothetical protein
MCFHNKYTHQESITMAQVAQNTMKYWKRGKAIIRPHLEIGDLWSYDQIKQKVDTMKQEIGIQNINIYEKNSYCYELNGSWNVVFGFLIRREDGTLIEYTYMVRRDHLLHKTYFCPFYVEGHGYCRIPKMEFTLKDTPQEFKIVEDYFKEKYNATEISTFPAL